MPIGTARSVAAGGCWALGRHAGAAAAILNVLGASRAEMSVDGASSRAACPEDEAADARRSLFWERHRRVSMAALAASIHLEPQIARTALCGW